MLYKNTFRTNAMLPIVVKQKQFPQGLNDLGGIVPYILAIPIIIAYQRITEDIDYIIASEGPEVSEVILDKASCLHIIDAIFDTDEIEYDEYLSRNHIRIQFIADNIADSINKLWHIIQYDE